MKVGKQGSLTTVSSGSASSAIPLVVGSNALKVEVTAEDGTTTQTYTVTVTRQQAQAQATDATLSALTGNTSTDGSSFSGTLNIGTFASGTTTYTTTVANTVTHVKLTPTVNDSDATVKVGKQGSLTTVSSGSASSAIPLVVGSNALKVEVTAEDGTTTQTYTVTVTRQQPANAPTDTPTNKSTPRTLTKTNSPNNPPGIHPPPPPLQQTLPPVVSVRGGEPVTEGGEARFTLSTTPAPASGNTIEVNVSVSQHGDFAGRTQTGSRTVVIDESGTAVFTVATAEDAVHEPDGAVTVVVEGGRGYTPHGGDNRASVTVEDNDDPALVVSPSSLKLTEGGSASYTVTLETGPTGVVRVSVSGHGATDLILEPASPLVFTPENWSTPQVVVVSAPQPSNAVGHSLTLSHVATGSGYGSAPPVAVKVGVRADPTGKNAWHIRFGRTVSQQVVDVLQQRFSTSSSTPSGLQLTVAGEALTSDTPLEENHVLLSRLLGFESVSSQEVAQGSSFSFSPEGAGARLSFWGQGALSSFNGVEESITLTGEVTTAVVGAEWRSERWRAGAALSHSWGSGSYQGEGDGGDGRISSSSLTGIFPYGRYALTPRLGIWATAGYGWGNLTLNPDGDGPEYNPATTMALGAVGMDGLLLDGGSDGVSLTTTADVLLLKTSSEAVVGLASSEGEVSRFRLGLEASRAFPLANGASLSPSLEVGLRQDSGDAETGFGMDLGAGLSWSDPEQGITAAVKGRTLLSHGAEDFQDQGLALSFSWQPSPSNRGASLSLSHAVGLPAEGGLAALLNPTAIEVLDEPNSDGERFEARLAYGFPFYNDRLTLTPSVALALSSSSRSYGLLWSLAPHDEHLVGEPWQLSLEGELREDLSSSPTVDHSLKLRFALPL